MNSVQVKTEVTAVSHMAEALATDWKLYNVICNHENCTVYDISKHLNWPTSKAALVIKRLIRAHLVREEVISERAIKVIVPVRWTEYFTETELEELKRVPPK